jgi:hypothetical protein
MGESEEVPRSFRSIRIRLEQIPKKSRFPGLFSFASFDSIPFLRLIQI